jgi:hypothetical protein
VSTKTEAYALFEAFLHKLAKYSSHECDVTTVRQALTAVNNFLYQKPETRGTFTWDGDEFDFFSKYHVFWHNCNAEILEPKVDETACAATADILHQLRLGPNGKELFYKTVDTRGLEPRALAQVRFFTAPQDFRGSIDSGKSFDAYISDPDRFNPSVILDDVDGFLRTIMTGDEANEQRDAREKFARTCAQLLVDLKCDAYDLAARFDGSAARLRSFLSEENQGTGFGRKKCDMFLRDMIVWKVWHLKDVECIDVASDANTIRVALRARILTTAIPLLSSFLDVFCYQYELIDSWNARAWRSVWEQWRARHPETCPECPALLDYLAYRIIGREFCRDQGLSVLECDGKPSHVVYWHSAQKKVCPVCHGHLHVVSRHLPCTHDQGRVAIQHSQYVSGDHPLLPGIAECPLVPVCRPRERDFRKRIAPDSISIRRATGWLTAYTTEEQAGGGLSS